MQKLNETISSVINEATVSRDVKQVMDAFEAFDADDAENLFTSLSDWYKSNADELTNIDCAKLSALLKRCAQVMNARSGN